MQLTLLLVACQTYQVHPFEIGLVKPYSGDCHFKNVVTGVTRDVPAAQCDLRTVLLIPIASAKSVLGDLQINCVATQCVAITGAGDQFLLTIDQNLQKVPF